MSRPLVFVNIAGDPNEETQKNSRRNLIATYVGRYHRNRSKPLQKSQFRHETPKQQHQIMPAAFKGNSDPFSAMPLDIDPATNEIISFYRETLKFMAAVSPTGWAFWQSTPASIQAAWAFMTHPRAALSFIARAAMLAAVAMPSYRSRALILSNRSMEALRKDISQPRATNREGPERLYTPMIIHWSIETLAGNAEAAALHGLSVVQIFERQKQTGCIDFKMLRYVLHMDAIASAKFLRNPLCSTRDWCIAELGSDEALSDALTVGYDREGGLEWQDVLVNANQVLYQWQLHCSGAFGSDEMALTRLFYQVIACHGLIVRSYVSVKRANDPLDKTGPILLAALFWFRAGIFHFSTGGLRFYDTVAPIYSRLLLAVSQAEKADGGLETWDRDTRLWLLCTGAQMEQMLGLVSSWFMGRLKESGFRTGIVSWPGIEELLRMFVYTRSISPSGSSWFSRVAEAETRDA